MNFIEEKNKVRKLFNLYVQLALLSNFLKDTINACFCGDHDIELGLYFVMQGCYQVPKHKNLEL